MQPSRDIHRLIEIMAALRDPDSGCPWDVEQSFASIVPYTIEEAYEVADAIERGDTEDLREELGDLLLQVVFHARMAEEAGLFDFGGVVEAITAKLIRRHPHVFGDARELDTEAVKALWGAHQGRREARARRGAAIGRRARRSAVGRARRRSAVSARAVARAQASGEGRQGRVRLGRRSRGRRQAARGGRRGRSGNRRALGGKAVGRGRRPPVRRGEPRPSSPTSTRRRRCAARTPSSSAGSPISNSASPRAGASRKAPISTRWRRCGSKPRDSSARPADPCAIWRFSEASTSAARARCRCASSRRPSGPPARRAAATVIQSGNVVFASDRPEATCAAAAAAVQAKFGFRPPIVAPQRQEPGGRWSRPIRSSPPASPPKTLHVACLAAAPSSSFAARLDPRAFLPDEFVLVDADVYLKLPNGVAKANLTNARLDRMFGGVSTMRNWRTVLRLLERLER